MSYVLINKNKGNIYQGKKEICIDEWLKNHQKDTVI